MEIAIGPEAIEEAAQRIAPYAHITPVLRCATLDRIVGGSLLFKCENFQKGGAFKFRGACNAVMQLSEEERRRGVITHSSGNHAQALALAGRLLGIPVCVVMPTTAPHVKRAATEGYGARVVSCEPTLAAREEAVEREVAAHGYVLVHPYDDWRVIAGQGTAAWELVDQVGPVDAIVTPCGGGGLLAGSALAASRKAPGAEVIGVEPSQADDGRRSLAAGTIVPSGDPRTVADGLRTSLGERPFAVIRRHVSRIATATEAEIIDALQLVWERMKLVIEPSCAVPLAAILNGQIEVSGRRVGVILSGGNVDLGEFFAALRCRWVG
ncbi:MAG: serine/threonine dehydratase [Isosphaeraceae bacterium]|nr:MAG: serine/threonine dehydratase [Isosphaeraceae bacterium]